MKERLKIKLNREMIISILFFGSQINYYIANILDVNGLPTITWFVYALLYVLGISSYVIIFKDKVAFFSFSALAITLIISLLINDATEKFMFDGSLFSSSLTVLLFIYFPVFLNMTGEVDFERLMRYFTYFSMVTLVLAVISFASFLLINVSPPPDYMSFAYMMLNPTLICFMLGWKNNKFTFILSVVAIFIVFIVGCRGAVVSIAVFLFLYVLRSFVTGKNDLKGFLFKVLLLLLIVLVAVNVNSILEYIGGTLKDVGFTSRTVDKLSLGASSFTQSESRADVFRQAISNIGFLGKGLFGDRIVIIDEYSNHIYAHNIFLELLLDFGFVIGFLFICFMMFLIIKSISIAIRSKNQKLIKMSFAMIAVIFVKHMVSASFLTSFDFWFYMGFAVNLVLNRASVLKNKNKTRKTGE